MLTGATACPAVNECPSVRLLLRHPRNSSANGQLPCLEAGKPTLFNRTHPIFVCGVKERSHKPNVAMELDAFDPILHDTCYKCAIPYVKEKHVDTS